MANNKPKNVSQDRPAKVIVQDKAPAEVVAVQASHNPTMLVWPTDVWGFTAALKDALVAVASRVNGAPDKKALVDAVLATGLAHLEAKYANDSMIRQNAINAAIAQNEAKEAELEDPAQGELF